MGGSPPAPGAPRSRLRRPGLVAAPATLVGGGLAKLAARAAHAADGGNLVLGSQNAASATTTLDRNGAAPSVAGLEVQNNNYDAVQGLAAGTLSYGVCGQCSAGHGVGGASTTGTGVSGASASGVGAVGDSASGWGAAAYSDAKHGLGAQTFAAPATLDNGVRVAGVFGVATKNAGVYGYDLGAATTLQSFGVVGHSLPAYGVFGYSAAPAGTLVNSPGGQPPGTIAMAGVIGTFEGNPGVDGISNTSIGVVGQSQNLGVLGGLIAGAGPTALADLFLGNVQIQGSLTVTGSYPKSGAVPLPDGTLRRLYCMESPEAWLEDLGRGQLVAGRATVALDPEFAPTVRADANRVFLEP